MTRSNETKKLIEKSSNVMTDFVNFMDKKKIDYDLRIELIDWMAKKASITIDLMSSIHKDIYSPDRGEK